MTSIAKADPKLSFIDDNDQMIDLLCKVLSHNASREHLIALLSVLSDAEWSALYQTARQQAVVLLLYGRLRELNGAIKVPGHIIDPLHRSSLTAATRNMLMLHEAGQILKALRSQNLDVIPLKGLYLVENVYQELSLRTFSDLDLLVRKPDLDAAIACLQSLGYQLETYYSTQDANRDIKHAPPMINQNGFIVEIHWTILEEDEPFTIPVDGIWNRATHANVAGVKVPVLSMEDLLLHLSLHLAYQHKFNIGLRGLYDIVAVLHHAQAHLDWQKLISIASEWGVERVVWLVFKLMEEIFSVDIPQEMFHLLIDETVLNELIEDARVQLIKRPGLGIAMTPDLARMAAARGLVGRLKVGLSRVFISRQVLARLYNVPPKSPAIIGCYFNRLKDLMRMYGHSIQPVWNKKNAVMAGVAKEQTVEYLENWMSKAI